jgi:hypothetical protein
MEELIEQRLNAMLAVPIETLRSLPDCKEEEVTLDGRKIRVMELTRSGGQSSVFGVRWGMEGQDSQPVALVTQLDSVQRIA